MGVQLKTRVLAAVLLIASMIAVASSPVSASATFVISTYVGTGSGGFSGDGGPATSAQIGGVGQMTFDAAGNLYIADAWGTVRKVAPGGTISTAAGTSINGYSGDGGAATSAQVNAPSGVAVDSSGNLYIADYNNHRVRKVNAGGIISTIAGTGSAGYSGDGGAATSAQLTNPSSVAVDAVGNVYIADAWNHRIRKVNASGIISTVAGTGSSGFSGDTGAATSAQIQNPYGIFMTADGTLYIADSGNNRIRKVTTGGIISTVAGNGTYAFAGDGAAATSASLKGPQSIWVDTAGNMWITDTDSNRVRKVDSGGTITTVVGTGAASSTGDNGDATTATINSPDGIAIDTSGNLLVAESSGYRIRKVALIAPASGTVSVSAIVDPSFTFTVVGRASACNSQAPGTFATGATGTAVQLGHLAGSSSVGGAQDVSIATNAGNGAVVNVRAPAAPNALSAGGGHSIADVTGTHAAAGTAPTAGTPGFGYTTDDSTIAFGSNKFAKLTTVDNSILSAGAGTVTKSACVGYQASSGTTTYAGNYSVVVIYTAIPTF